MSQTPTTKKQFLNRIWKRIYADIFRIRYALLILLFYFTLTQSIFHTVCPFAILTGSACPACGLTRAALFLLSGQFIYATQLNATIYLWLPYLLYLFIFRYLLGKRPPLAMPLSIIICLTTIIFYICRLCTGTLPAVRCQGVLPLILSLVSKAAK